MYLANILWVIRQIELLSSSSDPNARKPELLSWVPFVRVFLVRRFIWEGSVCIGDILFPRIQLSMLVGVAKLMVRTEIVPYSAVMLFTRSYWLRQLYVLMVKTSIWPTVYSIINIKNVSHLFTLSILCIRKCRVQLFHKILRVKLFD